MRLLALLAAMCALCQTGQAQTSDCKSLANAEARLACYDKVAPPVAAKPPLRTPPAASAGGKYVDTISAEDALMNNKLHSICRGC